MKPLSLRCRFLITACVWAGLCGGAMAAPLAPAAGGVEVSAQESLEWHQDLRLYVARGGAKAVRDGMTVTADLLMAHERDDAPAKGQAAKNATGQGNSGGIGGGGSIDRLTAEGKVHIWDQKQQVFGSRAVYDLDRGLLTVTGKDLKYMTDKDVITAQQTLEYHDAAQMAIARGHARAVREGRHIEGDVLTAQFAPSAGGAAGPGDLSVMTAEGHVTVVAGETIARGDHAVYDVKRNVAVLTGLVRITRGQTQLTGDKAEVDFATGESRLLNEKRKGRVKALLRTGDDASKPAQRKTGE